MVEANVPGYDELELSEEIGQAAIIGMDNEKDAHPTGYVGVHSASFKDMVPHSSAVCIA